MAIISVTFAAVFVVAGWGDSHVVGDLVCFLMLAVCAIAGMVAFAVVETRPVERFMRAAARLQGQAGAAGI
jgi:hypothetical protein